MYFITNNDKIIVAASKDFLEGIGARDMCSVSMFIKNGQLVLDKENKEAKISDKEYVYNSSTLVSALGDLYLYSLTNKDTLSINSDDEDDNISYLKKIKEGVVVGNDNTYDIPEITKEETTNSQKEEVVDSKKVLEEINEQEKIDTSLSETSDTLSFKSENSETKESIKEIVSEIYGNSDKSDTTKTDSSSEIINNDKVANESNENELLKNIDEIELNNSSNQNNDIISQLIESEKKEKEKSSKFGGLKSKLFPWGGTSKDTQEQEIEVELEDSIQEQNSKEETNIIEEPTLKTINEAEKLKEDNNISDKSIDSLNINEDINQESDIDSDNINTTEKTLDLEEEELLILKETTSSDIPSIPSDDNTTSSDIPSIPSVDNDNVIDIAVEENRNEELKTDELQYKLIKMQVETIDFSENANKLSIDLDNYKLLLNNYIDELRNYKQDLETGDLSTINMLSDASQLLSLDIITKNLEAITNENERKVAITKLFILVDSLDNKLNSSDTSNEVIDVPIVESNKSQESNYASSKPIVDETSISDSEALLNKISSKEIQFDPTKASNELNLPESLILEFVNDFISQAKEHLPQIIDAHKKNDIKTIQTTAHMLKGAASNLRLDSIAEVLFKIQKENNLDKSEELIGDFASNLKGLEEEVNRYEKG